VQQLVAENHLRWDSLGEFLALAVSLDHVGTDKAKVLGKTLDDATTEVLLNNKSPQRKSGQLDNRGSHYYLALFWAKELAAQDDDVELKAEFGPIAIKLAEFENLIVEELNSGQGNAVELEGYYAPNDKKLTEVMRPSTAFNAIIDTI
jgi:isocitrate dehydrogenase